MNELNYRNLDNMSEQKSISINNLNDDKPIPLHKLRNWGLTNIVKREIIIDELISKFPEPNIEEKIFYLRIGALIQISNQKKI